MRGYRSRFLRTRRRIHWRRVRLRVAAGQGNADGRPTLRPYGRNMTGYLDDLHLAVDHLRCQVVATVLNSSSLASASPTAERLTPAPAPCGCSAARPDGRGW